MEIEKKKYGGTALLILWCLVNFVVLILWCLALYTGLTSGNEIDPARRTGGLNLLGYFILIVLPVIFFFLDRFIYVKFFKSKKRTEKKILKSTDVKNEVKERISEIKEGHSKKEVLGEKVSTGPEIDVKRRISELEAELSNLKALVLEDPESRLKVAHFKKELDLLKWLLGILIALAGIVIPVIIFLVRK